LYWTISAEGLRSRFDVFTIRLHKTGIPFTNQLGDYDETRVLDLGHVAAVVMLVVCWVYWEKVVHLFVAAPDELTNRHRLTWAIGTVVLVLDCVIFFLGVTSAGSFLGDVS